MSKYFDGYASFDYKEMSKEKLISELKEKVRYIGELKRSHNDEIAKIQSTKDKQIADLEAKLAESEERIKDLEFRNKNLEHLLSVAPNANAGQRKRIVELKEINHKLKQQLAEKDKEIENLNNRILISQLQAPKEQILNISGSQCIQYNPDQDKISFAVEQLMKAKGKIQHNILFVDCDDYVNVIEQIDSQIEELKKHK